MGKLPIGSCRRRLVKDEIVHPPPKDVVIRHSTRQKLNNGSSPISPTPPSKDGFKNNRNR